MKTMNITSRSMKISNHYRTLPLLRGMFICPDFIKNFNSDISQYSTDTMETLNEGLVKRLDRQDIEKELTLS